MYSEDEYEICLMYSISGGNHNFDNEHSEISIVKDKKGTEMLLVEFENGGYSMLWRSREGLTFSLDANVDEKELFKIKDGINIKK